MLTSCLSKWLGARSRESESINAVAAFVLTFNSLLSEGLGRWSRSQATLTTGGGAVTVRWWWPALEAAVVERKLEELVGEASDWRGKKEEGDMVG
ncbi:hypothetical protein Droror1_Dr00014468 [Drosera rotundifolia]